MTLPDSSIKKAALLRKAAFRVTEMVFLFTRKPFVYHFRWHNRFHKRIGSWFFRFNHFNGLCQTLWGRLKCCYRFLCHDSFILSLYALSSFWGQDYTFLSPSGQGSSFYSWSWCIGKFPPYRNPYALCIPGWPVLYCLSLPWCFALADYLMSIPFCFASFNTAEIPFLFIALRARVETLRVIHRSSSGI